MRTCILTFILAISLLAGPAANAVVMVEAEQNFGAFNYSGGTESFTLQAASDSALVVVMSNRFEPSTTVVFDPSGANQSLLVAQEDYTAHASSWIFVLPLGDVAGGTFDVQISSANRGLGSIYQVSGADQDLSNWAFDGSSKADEGNLSLTPGNADAGSLLLAVGAWGKGGNDTRVLSGTDGLGAISFTTDRDQVTDSNNGILAAHANVVGNLDLDFDTSIADSQDAMAFSVALIPEGVSNDASPPVVPEPAAAGLALPGLGAMIARRR